MSFSPPPHLGSLVTTSSLTPFGTIAANAQFDTETALALLEHTNLLQVQYGSIILSFLGAVHWGFEVRIFFPCPSLLRVPEGLNGLFFLTLTFKKTIIVEQVRRGQGEPSIPPRSRSRPRGMVDPVVGAGPTRARRSMGRVLRHVVRRPTNDFERLGPEMVFDRELFFFLLLLCPPRLDFP